MESHDVDMIAESRFLYSVFKSPNSSTRLELKKSGQEGSEDQPTKSPVLKKDSAQSEVASSEHSKKSSNNQKEKITSNLILSGDKRHASTGGNFPVAIKSSEDKSGDINSASLPADPRKKGAIKIITSHPASWSYKHIPEELKVNINE